MHTQPSVKLKPCWWDALVAAVVLLLAVGAFWGFYGFHSGSGNLTAVITHRGEEVERVALASLSAEETITVEGTYTVNIVLAPDGVSVSSATCPTQDCVHTGKITRAGQSIVCLPEQVIVQLVGAKSDVDAVLG
ncbi:MAG: NusG domain II-containing protein [Clostridiales bacterium]|nr:NusG domain II-containing protein [Clostridiales bacterium]